MYDKMDVLPPNKVQDLSLLLLDIQNRINLYHKDSRIAHRLGLFRDWMMIASLRYSKVLLKTALRLEKGQCQSILGKCYVNAAVNGLAQRCRNDGVRKRWEVRACLPHNTLYLDYATLGCQNVAIITDRSQPFDCAWKAICHVDFHKGFLACEEGLEEAYAKDKDTIRKWVEARRTDLLGWLNEIDVHLREAETARSAGYKQRGMGFSLVRGKMLFLHLASTSNIGTNGPFICYKIDVIWPPNDAHVINNLRKHLLAVGMESHCKFAAGTERDAKEEARNCGMDMEDEPS